MIVNFPCNICAKATAKSYNAVCCDICNLWVHIKCNNIIKPLQKTSAGSRNLVLSKIHETSTTFSESTYNQLNRITKGILYPLQRK